MQTTVKLEVILLEEHIKLSVSQQIFDKIRYLCKVINKVEWSGVLFYTITGTVQNPAEFSLDIKDILLMDKGTSGYTEYNFDTDVSDFIMDRAMEDPEWMQIKIGHIHSHNSMGVFFSGTDMDELFDNCSNHNFYLSLIVNNAMDMIAKLVFRGMPINSPYEAVDENGKPYQFTLNVNKEKTKPILFVHDCDVDTPFKNITVSKEFADRADFIIKDTERKNKEKADKLKEEKEKNAKKNPTTYKNDDWNKHQSGNNGSRHNAPYGRGSNFKPYGANHDNVKNLLLPHKGSEDDLFNFQEGIDFNGIITEHEQFMCYVLRMGDRVEDDYLEMALEAVDLSKIEPALLSSTIIDNYGEYYNRFYNDLANITMEDFCDNILETVETLDDYRAKYDFIPDLVRELREFGTKLEVKWKEEEAGVSS